MIRVCHFWCLSCYGDKNVECHNCDTLMPGLVQSGSTCAMGCQGTWGINLTNPLICLKCMSFCNRCYAAPTNCS
jgi:hypothetical protein